ncbi:MAG: efflux RND transporter periplasmic adaptor subunit [Desulfobacteraceae bacterium]|nr:efflux RND transporter periplasmic adaptor subunit [Desulfobacteraceae bacterium]
MKKILIVFLIFIPCIYSCSDDKITPGIVEQSLTSSKTFHTTLNIKKEKIIDTYEAVGTVHPLTKTSVEAQISAQILKVLVTPGKAVVKGDVLVYLDARNEQTQLEKAKQGLAFKQNNFKQAVKSEDGARAGLNQAQAEFDRTKKLYKSGILASQQFEIDKATYLKAKAMLERATEAVLAAKTGIRQAEQIIKEAQIILGYSIIKAPATGVIIDRNADPGDLAVPGKPLLVLQTSGSLRLEANIREGMISKVHQGGTYDVRIEAINKIIPSMIEEIVPYADPNTRTFLVKATLPKIPGLYPGMFGRLLIPVKEQEVILIPKKAFQIIGQLELVHIKEKDGHFKSIYIKTGKQFADRVEVLSGLTGNETIGY